MKQLKVPDKPLNGIVVTALAAAIGIATSHAQLVTGLKAVDVGTPPLPGSTTANGPGSFAVTGSGEYKNSGTDNFHFAYTNVSGDFDYRVRLESVEVASQWSKGGMMVRETTDASVTTDLGSRYLTMAAYPPAPSGGDLFILIRREQTGTVTLDDIAGTKPTYPNTWLRMRRLGTTVVGYTGTNGLNWDVQGIRDTATWTEGALNPNLLLGIAVSSAKNTATCTVQCREFGLVPATNAVAITAPLQSLTVNKGRTAIFTLGVSGYDPFSVQWYTNGVLAATDYSFSGNLSYTNGPLSLSDNNTRVSVVVRNSINSVTNQEVVLHVVDDNTPPSVTSATTDNAVLDVLFSEEVTSTSVLDMNNYTLTGAPGADLSYAVLNGNQRIASVYLLAPIDSTNATLTVRGIQDLVENTETTQTVPVWLLLAPSNIVASGYADTRTLAFSSVTDGVVDDGWQTTGDKDHRPQFAGLIYTNLQRFQVVKMDLGLQNQYGGSFAVTPKLYLLKNNVDTDIAGPETDSTNWVEVSAAQLVSPNLFDAIVDPNPSPASPIVFDLSALPDTARSAYGWAIGGVSGDNSGFIRISELRAYGLSLTEPPKMIVSRTSGNGLVISWPTAATGFVLKSTTSLNPANWSLVSEPQVVQGDTVTVTVLSTNQACFYRLEQ